MITLAFMRLLAPIHVVPVFVVLLLVGGAVGIFFLGRASVSGGGRGLNPGPFPPTDADLERRRKALELDRMAIENEERRRKLNQ